MSHSPPLMPSSSSRARLSTRGRATITLVLTLCVAYAEAAPLSPIAAPPTASPSDSTATPSSVMDALAAAGRTAWRHVPRRDGMSTINLDTSSDGGPAVGIARVHFDGVYHVPNGYVRLVQRFNPGFIILAYAIAVVGSLCTLELLIRRTTNSGWRNQVLLASAGFTFGAMSTFAMHFIFNNSLSLHNPLEAAPHDHSLHLAYNAGYTVLSLVTSCLAMTVAFFIMGTTLQVWWCIPGVRKPRRDSAVSEVGERYGDEDGSWKGVHRKVWRTGTMGIGASVHSASKAAKWSLIDAATGHGRSRHVASPRKSKGMSLGDGPEAMLHRDKQLEELDFRLGRSAVTLELERRFGSTSERSMTVSRMTDPSLRVIPSEPSLQPEPMQVACPPTRRGSLPFHDRSQPSGYRFLGERKESHPSAEALPSETIGSSRLRRASLPTVVYTTRTETTTTPRQSSSLGPIQSLPETDTDLTHIVSHANSIDKQWTPGTPPTSAQLDSFESQRGDSSPTPRRVGFAKPALTAIEKFLGFDVVTRGEIVKIVITGSITGLGVAAMHYIGQLSIIGIPYIAYKAEFVVGSVLIACGAVIIALYIMFIMLRPKLKHTWISKIGVAFILAFAVCSMHYTGMRGTIYAWPIGRGISPSSLLLGTNRVITAIVAALALLTSIACTVFFVLQSLKNHRERARRRRVVVAAVFLDGHDRVLVNATDGMLPMCDIANLTGLDDMPGSKKSTKSNVFSLGSDSTVLGMDLTPGHDAFLSALKMSWAWRNPSVALPNTLFPPSETAMGSSYGQTTFAGTIADIRRGSAMTMESSMTNGRASRLSKGTFLERFAVSSGQLALQLVGQQDGISRLGVLYDQILTTGWVKLSHSNDTVSKGQLVFLVKRINSSAERTDLLSRHFIFADSQAVAASLHKTLSVPIDHTIPLLADISLFCDTTIVSTLKPGVMYAGVAVVQATPFDGLRVLVEHDNRAQLPMRELCPIGETSSSNAELSGTVEELGEAISWLEGMSLLSIIARNMGHGQDQLGGPRVTALLQALERAIIPMLDEMVDIQDMAHILPRLHLHPCLVPLTPGGTRKTAKLTGYTPPYMIVFYANYDATVNTFTDKWLPFSLFRAQNACVMGKMIAAAAKAEQVPPPEVMNLDSPLTAMSPPTTAAEGAVAGGWTGGTGGGGVGGSEDGRRPSKVQFEPIMEKDKGEGGMFNDFTFPKPATNSTALPPSTTTPGRKLSTPMTNTNVPRNGPIGHPTKSSFARGRFGSDVGLTIDVSKEKPAQAGGGPAGTGGAGFGVGVAGGLGIGGVEGVGVASWDPDWLLMLLRTKLRTEA